MDHMPRGRPALPPAPRLHLPRDLKEEAASLKDISLDALLNPNDVCDISRGRTQTATCHVSKCGYGCASASVHTQTRPDAKSSRCPCDD